MKTPKERVIKAWTISNSDNQLPLNGITGEWAIFRTRKQAEIFKQVFLVDGLRKIVPISIHIPNKPVVKKRKNK